MGKRLLVLIMNVEHVLLTLDTKQDALERCDLPLNTGNNTVSHELFCIMYSFPYNMVYCRFMQLFVLKVIALYCDVNSDFCTLHVLLKIIREK